MQDNIFCDSNIFLYLLLQPTNEIDRQKQIIIRQFLSDSNPNINIFVSTQVLNEVANVLLKKKVVDKGQIIQSLNFITNFATVMPLIPINTIDAIKIQSQYRFSFYDSLILASALAAGCSQLITEDLQDHQIINYQSHSLTVINPFK